MTAQRDDSTTPGEKRRTRSLVAILTPLAALVLQLALGSFFQPSVWFLFYPAVFISSWIGGLRAGVVSTALSAAAVLWFFAPPVHTFIKPPGPYLAAAVFFATGVLFGIFHDRLRRANAQTEHALKTSEAANDQLQRARDALASFLEQAPDGIFVANTDGRYTDVNSAGCRMLGYTREEIVGKTIVDLIPPDRIGQLERERAQMLEGRVQVSEWTLRRKDGTYLPVEVSARILPDGRWQGFVRDSSIRKQLEEALRASHGDLNRAQSVASVGSWRLDIRRNELQWSDENYRIFGVPPGTPMTYEAFLACIHPDDRAFVDRAWNGALRGQPYDIEHRIVAGGGVKWVREKADLEFDEQHALVGGIGITQDITARKQHEQERREAEERFELALGGADLAAWDWNIESGQVIFNPRWAEMRGFRPDEIAPHVNTWISGVHPDDLPRVQRVLEDYFQGRIAGYETEHRVRTKSGQWIWILDRGKVFARNERGEPIRMVGTELDITARKRAEEELRLAEAKASGIVSISADAIICIDEDQRITLFNDGAEKIFGYSAADAIGAPLDMLMPERFRAMHRQHVRELIAGPRIARRMGEPGGEIWGVRRTGEEFPADAAISKLEVGGKRILTVSLRDITGQKALERAQTFLAEVGAVFASTLEYDETVDTIARLAVRELADFCIVDVILEGELQRQKVVSRDPACAWVCELFDRITLDRSRPHLTQAVFETGQPVLIEHLSAKMVQGFAQSDDHLHALQALDARSLIVVPLTAHDKLLGAVALVASSRSAAYGRSDLRLAEQLALRAALALENARLYRLARQATQARDEVLSIVAHDLRNPLGTILIESELLRRPGGLPERRSMKESDAIHHAATRMDRLIDDLLDVTRMESGRLAIEQRSVSAADVISESVDAQRTLAASGSIELLCDIAAALPHVWGDRDRLLQVFENLIGNAIAFTKPGGRITVGAAAREGGILFWVADTGSGIAAEDLPYVFDRFWQSGKRRGGGAGLGLAIAKGIVEAHGGRMWVESTPGHGSTFFFEIPAARVRRSA